MSDRDAILAIVDSKVQELHIPEWNNRKVFIRVLTGAERDKLAESAKILTNLHGRFAALVLGDDKGNRIFTDNDAADLGKKSGTALERIFQAGMKLNSMDGEAVDDAEKKSDQATSVATGTASPS